MEYVFTWPGVAGPEMREFERPEWLLAYASGWCRENHWTVEVVADDAQNFFMKAA